MKRFQNKMAESRWSLTITSIICLLAWLTAGTGLMDGGSDWLLLISRQPAAILQHPMVITLPCVVLSTYLMVELNNANALIRIYSRMVSCTFLVLMTIATFQYQSVRAAIVTLCIIGFYTTAFHSYQANQASGWIFYAFLCVGIASIAFVQMLYFLPLLWLLMATKLFSFSLRTFVASLLGIALPYLIFITYCVLSNDVERFAAHFTALAHFEPLPFLEPQPLAWLQGINVSVAITVGYIILLFLIGSIHYLRTRQNDRIRTQMFYETFITANGVALLFLLLQPQHMEVLLGIIIVNTAPLVAHFMALTQTKWTNMLTIALLLMAIAITSYNLWSQSFSY